MIVIFEVFDRHNGNLVGYHEVKALSIDEAWANFGMGLADYPKTKTRIVAREKAAEAIPPKGEGFNRELRQ